MSIEETLGHPQDMAAVRQHHSPHGRQSSGARPKGFSKPFGSVWRAAVEGQIDGDG